MKRFCMLAILAALSISICYAQDDDTSGNLAERAQPAPTKPADNVIKGSFPVRLEKTLDSSKLKAGDTVICRTVTPVHSRSGLTIPSGSRVIGHVTEAKARANGDADSMLTIEFDKLEYAKGEEVPMKGTFQAIAPSLGDHGPDMAAGPHELAVSSRGGASGLGSPGAVDTPPPAHGGSNALSSGSMQTGGPESGTPILQSDSKGVLGLKNLQMGADGALTSTGKEVKLDSGLQVLIHAEIEAGSRK